MKNNEELINHLISKETKIIESMLHLSKEDELTILRLQDKLKAVERNIEEHKQLIKEYRDHLRCMSEPTHTKRKQNPVRIHNQDMGLAITRIKSVAGKLKK